MTDEKTISNEGANEGDSDLALGFIDREYAKHCARPAEDQTEEQTTKYPIVNFLGGTIPTDRQRHENTAEHGGLKHWRSNTSKQRADDDLITHIDKYGRVNYDIDAPAIADSYRAAEQSTGMGLEVENLASFITGTRHKIVTIAPNLPAKALSDVSEMTPTAQLKSYTAPGVRLRIASKSSGRPPAAIYNYRSKASLTYTDLPAIAVNQ